MADAVEDRRSQRIAEMKLREKISNKNTVMESSLQQDMLALLRFDNIIGSMRYFDEHQEAPIDDIYDKKLRDLVLAYKGSAKLIYGDEETKSIETLVGKVKQKLEIKNPMNGDIKLVMDLIPETQKIVAEVNQLNYDIHNGEESIEEWKKEKRSKGEKVESDKEAAEIIEKLNKRYKEKDRSAQVTRVMYANGTFVVKLSSKKGETTVMPNEALFKPLNNLEGLPRLNDELERQKQKSANSSKKQTNNKGIDEQIAQTEKGIAQRKRRIENLTDKMKSEINDFFQKLPADEFLEIFQQIGQRDFDRSEIFEQTGNLNEVKKNLVDALKKEEKIWHHVEDDKYFDMVKRVVRKGSQKSLTGQPINENYKNSILYKAFSPELKDLIDMREIQIYGFNNPSAQSIEEANKIMAEKHGYRVALTKTVVPAFVSSNVLSGKTNAEIAQAVLENANKPVNSALGAYQRRNKELGLMYSLGEGKDDDRELFKEYMEVYFDKKDFDSIESIKLQKDYHWEEYKNLNAKINKDVYQEISTNAENPAEFKQGLKDGFLIKGNTDHIFERRDAYLLDDPMTANNMENLAKTIRWKPWQKDQHELKNFFSMTNYDGFAPYLAKRNGEFERLNKLKEGNEVYTEKPQVLKDGKWVDLVPSNTILITPNVTIQAPELPQKVQSLALDCFKPLDKKQESENVKIGELRRKKEALELA